MLVSSVDTQNTYNLTIYSQVKCARTDIDYGKKARHRNKQMS